MTLAFIWLAESGFVESWLADVGEVVELCDELECVLCTGGELGERGLDSAPGNTPTGVEKARVLVITDGVGACWFNVRDEF